MKVSLNSLQALVTSTGNDAQVAPNGRATLERQIGAQLGAIEETIDFGAKYQGVIVVKVVSVVDHPNADRLHVCAIDDGGITPDVKRDENGYVQVVCGAPNVRDGITVAWLPPGSTVPETYGKDPFVLGARELRGVMSNGMLASPRELALGDSHDGILEIDGDIAPGTLFAAAFNLRNDVIFDIENKMFTHRPDCFGLLGVAREVMGIQGVPFVSPAWYTEDAAIPTVDVEPLPLIVENELSDLVPRFTAITMRDVRVGASPVWLQIELAKSGIRSINNIVDYTNYFMLLTGQPLHAYDYDKVMAQDAGATQATLRVRYPHADETIQLLNGKQITPRPEAILIATRDRAIGIGGVMGGADTEVDANTRNIIIECATFDMYSIRRTSMAHGLFTDAVTRFSKGQSPLQNQAVIAQIVAEIAQYAGGKIASELIDVRAPQLEAPAAVVLSAEFVNRRLGFNPYLSAEEIAALLRNVEFDVALQGDTLNVKAPFWRTDIEIPEDIVEEVGRLYGFDHVPLVLPSRTITPAVKNPTTELYQSIRHRLAGLGANEVLTYSFVHGNLIDATTQQRDQAFKLSNAISPDLQYYRLSLTPSLLDKVHANIKSGHSRFALFEIGVAHHVDVRNEDGLPRGLERLAFVYAANDVDVPSGAGAALYDVKQYLYQVVDAEAVTVRPLNSADVSEHAAMVQLLAPFELARSATIWNGDKFIGVVGEYKASIRKALKLPVHTAGFELFVSGISLPEASYVTLPKFPKIEQDICLKVPATTSFASVDRALRQALNEHRPERTRLQVSTLDIYQRDDDPGNKQITFRVSIAHYDKTLTDQEVAILLDSAARVVHDALGAERI